MTRILACFLAVAFVYAQRKSGFQVPAEANAALADLARKVNLDQPDTKTLKRSGQLWTEAIGKLGTGKLAPGDRPEVQQTIDSNFKPIAILPGGVQSFLPQNPMFVPVLQSSEKDMLLTKSRSVGRLSRNFCTTTETPYCFSIRGTLFMIGAGLAATNCHVLKDFVQKQPSGVWQLKPGVDLRADFGFDRLIQPGDTFPVQALAGCSAVEGFDVALLRLAPASKGGLATLPPPLETERAPLNRTWSDLTTRVYTIGYPRWSEATADLLTLRAHGAFGRIASPGIVSGVIPKLGYSFLQHSSTTAPGNSGSPVLDMTTHKVIGVHSCCQDKATGADMVEPVCARVGGDAGFNLAIPTWLLPLDPALKPHLP